MYEEDAENEYEIEGDDSQWRHLKGATERQKKKSLMLIFYCLVTATPSADLRICQMLLIFSSPMSLDKLFNYLLDPVYFWGSAANYYVVGS